MPPSRRNAFKLFEVTGIELDYMVVQRDTLRVLPIVDQLFQDVTGQLTSDVEHGEVTWSNELASHVVELKTTRPARRIPAFRRRFATEVRAINDALATRQAMLLPTAAHPLMDPLTETVIWPHAHNEVYALYHRIFDCRGHGWSNRQSTHLNLPFATDEEFGKLHAAVRMVLPLIPALAASSPLLDGKATGFLDSRMEAYLHHQERLPALMGSLIPEAVFTQEDYYRIVFDPIGRALAPYDPEGLLDHHVANSRGAVARFDRGAIELRVIDAQECPGMDLAIAELITALCRAMAKGRWTSTYLQRAWSETDLLPIFLQTIKDAGRAVIANKDLLLMFGVMKEQRMTAQRLWEHIVQELRGELSEDARVLIDHILSKGCLAQRILARTGRKPSTEKVRQVYAELAACLHDDRPFA